MERKIGEIFEYNGEWYQCVDGNCAYCSLQDEACGQRIINDVCELNHIFKKLEKVGEPFTSVGKLYQHYKVFDIHNVCGDGFWCVHNYKAKTLTIELKQNKENMEEKKQCGDNKFRAIARAKEHLFQATNIAENKKELEVLDSFLLRCWQMGWLKQYEDGEEKKLNLKPFDIQKAREGKPVYTRDGRKARILCYDFKQNEEYPILVAVENKDGKECALLYSNDGISEMYKSSNNELAMLPEKKEGWVNIYKEGVDQYIYNNEKAALSRRGSDCIATIKIEWEE